jgi:hypothetical protein
VGKSETNPDAAAYNEGKISRVKMPGKNIKYKI